MKSIQKRLLNMALAVTLVLSLLVPLGGAVLADSGPTWTKYPGDVSLGGELNVVDTNVIKDGSTYKMWYSHVQTTTPVPNLIVNASAVLNSANIINDIANLNPWQLVNDLRSVNISQFANTLNGTATVIGYATSTDGVNWAVQNSTVFSGGVSIWDSILTPKVIKDNGTYKMYYTHLKTSLTQAGLSTIFTAMNTTEQRYNALTQLLNSTSTVIGYATSSNGVNWTVQNPEILKGTNGVWDSVSAPNVIQDGNLYKMYYTRVNSTVVPADLQVIENSTFNVDSLLNIEGKVSSVVGYADSPDGVVWTPRLVNGTQTSVSNSQVLAGGTDMLTGVSNSNVIKNGTAYQMWYTKGTTNLTNTTLKTLVNETANLVISAWNILDDFNTGNATKLSQDISNLDLTTVKGLLGGTYSSIGYATSTDGFNWTVQDQDPQNFMGSSTAVWNSVSGPSIVNEGTGYSMWYRKGIDDLTLGNLLGLLAGIKSPIGYAYFGTTLGPVDIALLPAMQSVNVGQVFNVTIQVDARAGAADFVQAYVDFNPTFMKVVDASGNILPDNATNPIIPGNSTELTVPDQNIISNTNGTAGIAYGRPVVGANATNVFILGTIRFKALTNGTSIPLSFHTEGLRTTKAILAGVTVTQNQTDASVNIAPSGTQAVLRIAVDLQFRKPAPDPTWITPMEVWLHEPGVAWTEDTGTINGALYHYNTNTSDTGIIELIVPPGTYDIRVKGITTLKNKLSNVVVAAPGPVDISLGTLIEGDTNGDNIVNELDYSFVLRYFGYDVNDPASPSVARKCDFNNDGYTNELDYSIILRNFGQAGVDVGD